MNGSKPAELEGVFELIAAAMVSAAEGRSVSIASAEAELHGLVAQGDGKPSQSHVWERHENDGTLRFLWRWYDQSGPFSNQPDMNILLLELRLAGVAVRSFEKRYED